MLSEVFYTILLTTTAGLILKLFSLAYKSKCKKVKFGCIEIIRNTDIEEKEHEFDIMHPTIKNTNEPIE